MKSILSALLLVVSFCALAQHSDVFDHNYIDVMGKAELEVVPDEIYLSISINETDNKGKETVEQLEMKMIKALKKLDVDFDNDFSVNDLASNFQEYWLKKSAIYSRKSYQLIVHDASMAGKVFVELEKLGISNINVTQVDHSEIEKFQLQVKLNAIKAGKAKAQYLAEAIGQNIGRALYIRENQSSFNYNNKNFVIRGAAMLHDDNEQMPTVQFEKIKLNYSVQVYFELK